MLSSCHLTEGRPSVAPIRQRWDAVGTHPEMTAALACATSGWRLTCPPPREVTWQGIRGYNVGSDYHFKRLLWLDWPAGTVTAEEFGEP
jgi:hypothetical protein